MSERVCHLVRNDVRTDYRVRKEAGSLARAGYDVTVIGVHTYGNGERERRDGFEIVRVPVARAGTPWGKFANLYVRAISRMADAAAETQAQVYHAQDVDALLPAWLAARRVPGSRLIYDAHEVGFTGFLESFSFYPFKLPGLTWLWSKFNDWLIPRHVDGMITVNSALATLQAEHYGIAPPRVVMNCPPRQFPRPEARAGLTRRLGLPEGTPVAICQGMFTAARGDAPALEATVRAAARFERGALLMIGNVGNSPQWEGLRRLASEIAPPGRVHLLPPVPPEELLEITAGGFVGLAPLELRGWLRLASPNKLFEYVNAGLPVLSSDLPLMREVIDRYACGMTLDFRDEEAIAGAVNMLLRDPTLHAIYAAGARRTAAEYNWEEQERVLLQLYRELLA